MLHPKCSCPTMCAKVRDCGEGRAQGSPLEELCPNRDTSPMVEAAGMG